MAKLSLNKLGALTNEQADRFIRVLISNANPEYFIAITFIKFGAADRAEDKRRFHFVKIADYLDDSKHTLSTIALNVMDKWNAYIMPTFFKIQPEKGKRGGKELIAGGSVLWADIDLPESDWDKKEYFIEKYKAWEIPPTVIISSGRGFHLFWKLESFVDDYKELEYRNRWLRTRLAGDDCFDAAHIMRLPGTKNYKKFWKVPPDVTMVVCENKTWGLDDFQIEMDENEEESQSLIIAEEDLPENFLENLPRDLKDRIVNGPAGESDRSANDWFVARKLTEIGLTPGQVYSVFMNDDWEVGAKGRTNNSYIVKTIQKAWKENKAVSVTRPLALLQPIIEKHLIHRDKRGKDTLEIPPQSLPIIKESCEFLLKHGYRFLTDKAEKVPYIVTEEGTIIRATTGSKEFNALLCNLTQFTPDSRAHRMFATGIVAYIANIALVGEMHPWSYLDPNKNEWRILLDHNTSRDILAYAPNASKEIRPTINGSDGVILTSSIRCHGKSITWTGNYEWQPVLSELIDLTYDNFPCHTLDKQFLFCFMLALPVAAGLINNGTLPLLHLTGGSGQGKSGTLKTISCFIHGTPELESGTTGAAINIMAERDFFIPFDDYETLPDYLQQFILTNASGAVRHKVKDVDSDSLAAQRAHLMLALTSIGDLEITTLRRRAIQISVSSSEYGREDYDDRYKEKLIKNRSMYWTAYIQFMCSELLPRMNTNTLAAKAILVANAIPVQEFKPLAPFITLVFEIGKCLAKLDERFIGFDDPAIITQLIDRLGISSGLVFESNNPIVEPLSQLFSAAMKKRGPVDGTKGRSSTGARIIAPLGDGVYLEEAEYFVAANNIWFKPEDCLVLSGLPSSYAIKLYNIGHKTLFGPNTSKAIGQTFSKFIKEGIGTNNLNALLAYRKGQMGYSRLYQLGGSNIYVQYVHGIDASGKGTIWRLWFPMNTPDEETASTKAKLMDTFKADKPAEGSKEALISMIEGLIGKAGSQDAKLKLVRMLVKAREL